MDKDLIFARYYNLTLRYLSYRPRSEKEIIDYLTEKIRKGASLNQQAIDQIVSKLKEYKFIDDQEFVKFWVEQRTKFKHKPLRIIKYELQQKGINKELIDDSLSKFESIKNVDIDSARKLAQKKLDFHRNLEPEKAREKVLNYLLRKGFSYEVAKDALKSLI